MIATRIVRGAVAGLAGGVVFGVLMHAMGMLPMVAGLIGSESVAVGWGVHLVISALIGGGFGLLLGGIATTWGTGVGAGLGYGALWWVLGPLLIMPIWMGMPTFQVNEMTLQSLVGHLLFGVVTGSVYVLLTERDLVSANDRQHARA